jgi:hypothetical protein
MVVFRAPIFALLVGLGTSVFADDSFWDQVQIHGFGSQAAVRTSDNRWFGNSPDTSFDFTEFGLNASARLDPRLLLAGQVLLRRAGAMYNGDPVLDYGLADLTLRSSTESRFGVRLGRIKNPLGVYNETRDVPFTHPGIFLPQVIYHDVVRNLVLSTDGGVLYGESYNDFGNLSLTIGTGQAVIDENVEWAYLGADFEGHMETDGNTWIGSFWYTNPSELLKLGLSGANLSVKFKPRNTALPTLDRGTTDILYWILSAQYNAEKWTITAEYAREPLQWYGYGPGFPNQEGTSEGYYFQGTYRLRPSLELMARYEEGFADTGDRNGTKREAATRGLQPANVHFTKILTAGIRWDINPHWMLRAEYAYNDGTFILSWRENPNPADRSRYWDLFSVQVAFRF